MSIALVFVIGILAISLVGVCLEHRVRLAEVRKPGPRTPERDQGFNEGLTKAAEIARGYRCEYQSQISACENVASAIEAARRS